MKTGQRYGKTQLVDDAIAAFREQGFHTSVRESRVIIDTVLQCIQHGLITRGNLTISELGSFSLDRNRRATQGLRIKYRTTKELKQLLDKVWEISN